MYRFQNHLTASYRFHLSPRVADTSGPPYGFAYARTALYYGLRAAGLKSGDELLIPDFICDVILEPLSRLGIKPVYFSLDHELRPLWDTLRDRLTDRTRAICMVHFFGQPQPVESFREFCDTHNLILVEDNSHGHGGYYQDKPLGMWGDIGISSVRKSFPVPCGGLLYLKETSQFQLPVLGLSPARPVRGLTAALLQRALYLFPGIRKRLVKRVNYATQKNPRQPPLSRDFAMSRQTREFMEKQNMLRILQTRQELYQLWEDWASRQRLTPVFPRLASGAMPLKFPAYTASREESRAWFDWGYRQGIDVVSWPNLPEACQDPSGSACMRWEKLVCFPIHQQMKARLLKEMLLNLPGIHD